VANNMSVIVECLEPCQSLVESVKRFLRNLRIDIRKSSFETIESQSWLTNTSVEVLARAPKFKG